jgi:hypothetical protein
MSFEESYAANIDQARSVLFEARRKFELLKREELIIWGRCILKSGSEYEGWLTKGKGAAAVYETLLRAESDLAHWEQLLRAERGSTVCEPCERTARLMHQERVQLSEDQLDDIRGLIGQLAESKAHPDGPVGRSREAKPSAQISDEEKAAALARLQAQLEASKGAA